MANDPIQLPIELVDLIARFALDSVPALRIPDRYGVGADATEDAQSALLHRLRLVCKEWASHFFCHGLFRRFTFKDDEHFREAMELWSLAVPPSSTRSRLVSATQPRIPVIQELTLLNLRHHESTPARNTRFKKHSQPHLSMSTAARIIELFAHNLTHLHITFVDCLYFPQSLIDAASKTSRFVSLTLSISIDGWTFNRPPDGPLPSEPTAIHPETMFEFLAAVPKLSQLTLLNWDVPFPFKCSSQIASHHITHLSLLGPGHASVHYTPWASGPNVDFLLAMSSLFVPSIKAMCLDVDLAVLAESTKLIAACRKNLEALSALTAASLYLCEAAHPEANAFPMFKVLRVACLHLSSMPTWPCALERVETLAVDVFALGTELEPSFMNDTTPKQIQSRWRRSLMSRFTNLKRLVIINPGHIKLEHFQIQGVEVTELESCDILQLMDLHRSPLK